MASYRLVMRNGPTPGKSFLLEQAELFVGRDLNNEIVINDPEVSRRHARFLLQGDGYILEDLGSTNGTTINGQRIMGPYALRPGEVILLGENVTMVYEAVVDPNATVISSAGQPVTVQGFPQSFPPAQSIPVQPVPPAQAYAGHVPEVPAAPAAGVRRKFPIWLIVVIILLVISCVCIGALWLIDSQNLWCGWFGWMFNMFSPGVCP
ncbi:FHA domain-containing protein [Ornatilinea apprima]|uniref:FHA domain-containing protein n=1 Tax=Ornatilinea apprima TaxID=1134406 RepID=UPI0009467EE4|nr:FHA domain-containing protein [Ornatilinea apprima]